VIQKVIHIIFLYSILWECPALCNAQLIELPYRFSTIPTTIIAKMDSFIVSNSGEYIFKNFISFDSVGLGILAGDTNYTIVYSLHYPNNISQKWKLWWLVDKHGNFINSYYSAHMVPNYHSDTSYKFSIDSSNAIAIFKKSNIPLGIDSLKAYVDFRNGRIVWSIMITFSKSTYHRRANCYYIDMINGAIIGESVYNFMY
jgi:hypothetical protein